MCERQAADILAGRSRKGIDELFYGRHDGQFGMGLGALGFSDRLAGFLKPGRRKVTAIEIQVYGLNSQVRDHL